MAGRECDDSNAPEELTYEQFPSRVIREGKERPKIWAQRPSNFKNEIEAEARRESQINDGKLPEDIVNLLAAREKQVFLSDSEEEKMVKKPNPKKRRPKKSGRRCKKSSKRKLRARVRKSEVKNLKMFTESNSFSRSTFDSSLHSAPVDDDYDRISSGSIISTISMDHQSSLLHPSTWEQTSPLAKSPWSCHLATTNGSLDDSHDRSSHNRLIGSLVREEGHIYSLAASGDLLYTGSDSKNIRVWKNQKEYSGFKANSGLVKSIVISDDKIFTGHQDGRIRVWKMSKKNPTVHKRISTLPTLKAYIKSSIKPSNYVEVRRRRNALWIKHFDAISSLSISEDLNYLYSASWDKSVKVWRVSDFKCLESIAAHDDAVNAVVAGFDGLVFTGSADGTVKVWRREVQGKGTKHYFSQMLLKRECAVTALAVNPTATIIYCGSSDGVVSFWEREKLGGLGGELKGHKLAVLCLATAGNMVFSGSADMGICVWQRVEKADHIFVSMLTGHNGPVKCLAVEVDGEAAATDPRWILYSGSLDKSVKMWRISDQAVAPPQIQGQRGREGCSGTEGPVYAEQYPHAAPKSVKLVSKGKPSL
ncbi:hypothetical protein Ancab_003729 [Ancistrocladus abbreviatus]